jgi:hypothetical protein
MKKSISIIILFLSVFASQTTVAQVRRGFGINIGTQPLWGPEGYDRVDYYYMPDIDVFYNVPNRQYIYLEQGRWIFARALPSRYHNFDLYSGYKVVVNDYKPYRNAASYRMKYANYKGNHDQKNIRNSNDLRYFENKDHPKHNKWQNERNKHNNGKGNNGRH